MIDLIYNTASQLKALLGKFKIKHFLSIILVGCLLITNTACASPSSAADSSLKQKADAALDKNDSPRPKTTGEWKQEARETENAPGKRIEKIAKESKEAVKEFGEVYPNTAEKSAKSFSQNID